MRVYRRDIVTSDKSFELRKIPEVLEQRCYGRPTRHAIPRVELQVSQSREEWLHVKFGNVEIHDLEVPE